MYCLFSSTYFQQKYNSKSCQESCMLFEKVLKSRTTSLRNSELPGLSEMVFIVVILCVLVKGATSSKGQNL